MDHRHGHQHRRWIQRPVTVGKMKVEKASLNDFKQVYPLLREFNNPKISKEQWQNLFSDYWNFKDAYCGYKLMDGSKVKGFISCIFSRKYINGKWEKFCNLSSWIVKKEYRNYSIEILYPLKNLQDYTITSFTPAVSSYKALTKLFKFKDFDRCEVIIPVLPRFLKRNCKITTHSPLRTQTFLQYLSEYEKKVFQDHVFFDCEHLVVRTDRGNLYLIFKKVYKRHLPFAKLYFAGDPGIFLEHLEELRFRIPLALKTVGLVVDSRFLGDEPIPFSKSKKFYMPMLYKSDRLKPHEIDYLYSEFFLLGL